MIYLGVSQNADDGAVFLHLGEVFLDFLLALLILPFFRVLAECLLLLALVPESHGKKVF